MPQSYCPKTGEAGRGSPLTNSEKSRGRKCDGCWGPTAACFNVCRTIIVPLILALRADYPSFQPSSPHPYSLLSQSQQT